MNITITLNETQEIGLQIYATDNGHENIQAAVESLVGLTAESMVKSKYREQQATKTVDEMAQELQ